MDSSVILGHKAKNGPRKHGKFTLSFGLKKGVRREAGRPVVVP